MHKLLAAAAGIAALMGLGTLIPAGVGQSPPAGKSEPFKVPVAQPAQLPPSWIPPSAPPAAAQSDYLPTTPGYKSLPPLPTTQSSAAAPSKVLPSGFPEPLAPFLHGPVQYSSDNFIRPGEENGKHSATWEFLEQNFDAPDPNRDITINPKSGPWAICVQWYNGKDAWKMAREMVAELQSNPAYMLKNACVWRSGVAECKAEQKRIRDLVDNAKKQREQFQASGKVVHAPPRIPVAPSYQVEYAVLICGFRDKESARSELDRLRKLDAAPDPSKVKLHQQYAVTYDDKGAPKGGEYAYIHPFKQGAMVVPNPSVPRTTSANSQADNIEILKKLNADEPFSLLNCPKKYTLAVRQWSLPAEIQTKNSAPPSLLEKLGFGGTKTTPDHAKHNAHYLADMLRKAKCEAYVLHTSHYSLVCVGSYDTKDHPLIPSHQQQLPQLNQQLQLDPNIQLISRPQVCEVPR